MSAKKEGTIPSKNTKTVANNNNAGTASFLSAYKNNFDKKADVQMSLEEYLDLCRNDSSAYATVAERLLTAIGEPTMVDTANDERLSRIFENQVIPVYETFSDFYGLEVPISKIVKHIKHAAQNLEESKQILYLLGPVGGGKSSIADRMKKIMESQPIYVLQYKDEQGDMHVGPMNENPLSLFDVDQHGEDLKTDFGISPRYLKTIRSPWLVKRLKECNGDLSKFSVVKRYPSIDKQIALSSTEPGDENNQDISALVGKVDISKMDYHAQNDPDAYMYSGALNRANRGLMEFIEMFKAPIKVLNPLLEATQSRRFAGSEAIGQMPFEGVILAHSNESEWKKFRNDSTNEAFIARTNLIKVPYCLRVDEELKIYEKLIRESQLADAPCAPGTLEMLAKFAVLTRLKEHDNSDLVTKMRVYNGEYVKDEIPDAKSIGEYRAEAGQDEGMDGFDTRSSFKVLSEVFNFHAYENSANPVHLMNVLETKILEMQMPEEKEAAWLGYIKDYLEPEYIDRLTKDITRSYFGGADEYAQNIFDRYVEFADLWLQDQDYRDPDTGNILNRSEIDKELKAIEKPARISNPKDFRNEVVRYVLRNRGAGNENPRWDSYNKLRDVIESKMFKNMGDMLPVISSKVSQSDKQKGKHKEFVGYMIDKGYTHKQVQLVVDYWNKNKDQRSKSPSLG